ncbi:hypothetical protein GCM10007171_33770 [Dickeya fangzhongdai]|nr:hypothetical protein GCM10007171_33770 [Dickeya fangzhongdai]
MGRGTADHSMRAAAEYCGARAVCQEDALVSNIKKITSNINEYPGVAQAAFARFARREKS